MSLRTGPYYEPGSVAAVVATATHRLRRWTGASRTDWPYPPEAILPLREATGVAPESLSDGAGILAYFPGNPGAFAVRRVRIHDGRASIEGYDGKPDRRPLEVTAVIICMIIRESD